jgi:hypothetical protein
MRYTLSADQKAFFDKHQFIEFEDLLDEKEIASLKTLQPMRDCFRSQPEARKIILNPSFASFAGELCIVKQLRFGFDEIMELPLKLPESMTLHERSTIQGLLCAVSICIEGHSDIAPNMKFYPCPKKPGSVQFFSPKLLWEQEILLTAPKQKMILIGYAQPRSLYIFQEKDPYTHMLKKFGYVFGDRLREEWHPTLLR